MPRYSSFVVLFVALGAMSVPAFAETLNLPEVALSAAEVRAEASDVLLVRTAETPNEVRITLPLTFWALGTCRQWGFDREGHRHCESREQEEWTTDHTLTVAFKGKSLKTGEIEKFRLYTEIRRAHVRGVENYDFLLSLVEGSRSYWIHSPYVVEGEIKRDPDRLIVRAMPF